MLINSIITGCMNFSVLTHGSQAFKASKKDYEEYRESILNPERLSIREDIFFNYTVPVILRNHDLLIKSGSLLRFVVAVGEALPKGIIKRFLDLEDNFPNIFDIRLIKECEVFDWRKKFSDDLNFIFKRNYSNNQLVPVLNFRLDDDDILFDNYFERVTRYLQTAYNGVYISLSKGYLGIYDGGYKKFYKIVRPYLAIGLGKVSVFDSKNKIILTENPIVNNVSHAEIANKFISVIDPVDCSYVWTMHYHSDTRSVDDNKKQSDSRINRFIQDNKLIEASLQEVMSFIKV